MSSCTTGTCPHGKSSFIWLGDGPEADGTYPWVHAAPVGPSHLEVCDLKPFATASEAWEAEVMPAAPLVQGDLFDQMAGSSA